MIPYGRQDIDESDIEAVVETLRSDWLTQGPAVPTFENKVCSYTNAEHAVCANSATSALHIACLALGLGKDDILWTSPITFVASANCALYCGASVDFVDIDSDTYNMSIDSLREKLESAKSTNSLPKIVIPVHFAGQSCDMKAIHDLSKEYGFSIIEDAAHAIGGSYLDSKIGSCAYSDITVFSFHPVKIITTGEGGMAMTNDPKLADKMRMLSSHGITRDRKLMKDTDPDTDGTWYYQQLDLGFNYRMTDLQAALGISQLERIDHYIQERHKIAKQYDEKLSLLPVKTQLQEEYAHSAYHLYVILIDEEKTDVTRREVFDFLRSNGISVNVHYIPVHLQPYYSSLGFKHGDFPVSESYYESCLTIPLFPTLSTEDQQKVIDLLSESLGEPS